MFDGKVYVLCVELPSIPTYFLSTLGIAEKENE